MKIGEKYIYIYIHIYVCALARISLKYAQLHFFFKKCVPGNYLPVVDRRFFFCSCCWGLLNFAALGVTQTIPGKNKKGGWVLLAMTTTTVCTKGARTVEEEPILSDPR